jgi:hypothetical protein
MEYRAEIVLKKGVLNVLPHQLLHIYDIIPLDHGIHVLQREKFSKGVEVAADSTGGDELQSSAAGTGYPVVITNVVQLKEAEKEPMTTRSGVMIRRSARSEVTRRIYDRGKDYLSSSIIENTNRLSSIGREQVSEVQVI